MCGIQTNWSKKRTNMTNCHFLASQFFDFFYTIQKSIFGAFLDDQCQEDYNILHEMSSEPKSNFSF